MISDFNQDMVWEGGPSCEWRVCRLRQLVSAGFRLVLADRKFIVTQISNFPTVVSISESRTHQTLTFIFMPVETDALIQGILHILFRQLSSYGLKALLKAITVAVWQCWDLYL